MKLSQKKGKGHNFDIVLKDGKYVKVPKKKFGWNREYENFLNAKRLEKIDNEEKKKK